MKFVLAGPNSDLVQRELGVTMQELRDYLASRRTIPSANLSEPGPTRSEIDEILTLAVRTPDHGKLAPWRFLLIRGENRIKIGEQLLEIFADSNDGLDDAQREKELTRLSRAPVVVTVISTAMAHPKIPVWEQQMSAGAVCMNMLHASAAHGYSAQWLTEWFSFDARCRPIFGLAEEEQIAGFIHIGTPQVPPTERPRPDVGELLREWPEI